MEVKCSQYLTVILHGRSHFGFNENYDHVRFIYENANLRKSSGTPSSRTNLSMVNTWSTLFPES